MEIKSGLATKEFTLDYDKAEKKYYLTEIAYGEWNTPEFENVDLLKEYLVMCWSFTDEQIKELLDSVNIQ